MVKRRIIWFLLSCFTIVIGLVSRHFPAFPLFIGDILWATNVYFLVRLLFANKTIQWITIVSLSFCYLIEISQVYHAPWINHLRHTLFGRLVLGEVFLWGDLLSYTVGVGIAIGVEKLIMRTNN